MPIYADFNNLYKQVIFHYGYDTGRKYLNINYDHKTSDRFPEFKLETSVTSEEDKQQYKTLIGEIQDWISDPDENSEKGKETKLHHDSIKPTQQALTALLNDIDKLKINERSTSSPATVAGLFSEQQWGLSPLKRQPPVNENSKYLPLQQDSRA